MTDGNTLADGQRVALISVQHASVLDVAIFAHEDELIVPSEGRAIPHARALVQLHLRKERIQVGT